MDLCSSQLFILGAIAFLEDRSLLNELAHLYLVILCGVELASHRIYLPTVNGTAVQGDCATQILDLAWSFILLLLELGRGYSIEQFGDASVVFWAVKGTLLKEGGKMI